MAEPSLEQLVRSLGQGLSLLQHRLVRTRQRFYALEAESKLRWRGMEPRLPVEFTSQFGEDLAVWDLVGAQPEGFFIEAGAFDGYRFSVTYPLEALGWRGLLVEALPEQCARCAALRTNSRVVHAALGNRDAQGETDFTMVADRFGGMLSHLPGQGYTAHEQTRPEQQVIRVPLVSLASLLADHRGEIDLLVLDVEGGEADAIDGLDLKRHRPRLMLVESGAPEDLKAMLASNGYPFAGSLQTNLIFIRDDQAAMFERARWLMM